VSDRNTSARIKALVDQTGKLITNQAIRETTPTAPKEIAEGKSRVMFAKSLDKTSLQYKLEQELQTALNNKAKPEVLYNILDKNNTVKDKSEYYNIVGQLENLIELGKDQLETVDFDIYKTLAAQQGITIDELQADTRREFAKWKDGIETIGKEFGLNIKYYPESQLTNSENVDRTINSFKKIINFFPNINSLAKEAPQLLMALKGTLPIGKSLKIDGKRITVNQFNEWATNEGKGKVKPWMKNVYQPSNWGYGKYGFKTKIENLAKQLNEGKLTQDQFALQSANLLTHPSLRSLNKENSLEGYNQTQDSNREAISFLYKNLLTEYKNSNNKKETLEDIINFLKLQTNHAQSILKGLVPVISVTSKPDGPKNKKSHNEHMRELFNANNDFLDILNKYKNSKNNKQAFFEIDNLVKLLSQSLTSESNRIIKDSTGASVQDSANPFANTFVMSGESNNQIMLAYLPGATAAEYTYHKYSPTIFRMFRQTTKANNNIINNSGVMKSKALTPEQGVREAIILDKALNIAKDLNAPVKKIRVFDFDDTLARTKSNVLYTMPDGKTGKLNAEQFAERGTELMEQGVEFDFSEFNKVIDGKKGPLFKVAEMIADKRGTQDM
jgi:hypothetical protein